MSEYTPRCSACGGDILECTCHDRIAADELRDEITALRARIAELEAATPTLELVGGEWEQRVALPWWYRQVGPYTQHVWQSGGEWKWQTVTSNECVSEGTAPTREAAIAAAQKALLEEVGKFVRVKI